MLEKLIWISAFMLVGARHPGATVGAVRWLRSHAIHSFRCIAPPRSHTQGATVGAVRALVACAHFTTRYPQL